MAHDFFKTTDDDNGDDLNDFESFLRDKEKAWTKPALEMTPTDESRGEVTPADVVADPSTSDTSSTETSENVPESPSQSAEFVVDGASLERATKLAIHEHPIVHFYATEESVAYQLDAEWQKMFLDSRLIAVTEMTAEQIIERFHELDRNVFLIRAQQQGLRLALDEVLQTKSYADREKLLELDRKERLKNQNKLKVKIKSERQKGASATSVKTASKGKSKGQKTADTLIKVLMYDRETAEQHLKAQGLLDESTQAYVAKLFA